MSYVRYEMDEKIKQERRMPVTSLQSTVLEYISIALSKCRGFIDPSQLSYHPLTERGRRRGVFSLAIMTPSCYHIRSSKHISSLFSLASPSTLNCCDVLRLNVGEQFVSMTYMCISNCQPDDKDLQYICPSKSNHTDQMKETLG
ncbi:hypothetical protein OCU04_000489 [Sclerotinia nivalis]|uniref:Uncharacterized protein n=1 Tax=Sclerotinia nivalis TaxID=352851 RepID=A0A9X0AW84_9HELO|nr:hypothetical protein OCU04_000489 [Sclerotinia nivalis]